MPFLRFSRDKRGYEHTYLVQSTNKRGKPIKPRILYWYRTPPGIRLGRTPFDDDVRRLLEAQNPGVAFDWATLANTPFPSQEPEFWRERRRAEKAAKQARREEEGDEAEPDEPEGAADTPVDSPDLLVVDGALDMAVDIAAAAPERNETLSADVGEPPAALVAEGASVEAQAARKRRRRGGRRRRNRPAPNGEGVTAQGATANSSADDPSDAPGPSSEEQE